MRTRFARAKSLRLGRVFAAIAAVAIASSLSGWLAAHAEESLPSAGSPRHVGLHYGVASFGEAPTHEWIAFQAYERFKSRLPSEIGTYLKDRDWTEAYTTYSDCEIGDTTMDPAHGNFILEGAEEEDAHNPLKGEGYVQGTWRGTGLLGVPCGYPNPWELEKVNIFNNHFWDPDQSGWDTGYRNAANDYAPAKCSLHKALRYWREFVLPNYPSQKPVAYYYLGRIAHLLADASVPAHVHNDGHGNWIVRGDRYEEYFSEQYASRGRTFYDATLATHLAGLGPLDYTASVQSCPLSTGTGFEQQLADLFYNLAQQAQHFDSTGADGDDTKAVDVHGADLYGLTADRGARRRGDDGISDQEVEEIVAVMLPKAVQSVAALYELFWAATHGSANEEFVVVSRSDLFTLDTRGLPAPEDLSRFVVVANSALFVLDTRSLRIGTVTESAMFTLNTLNTVAGGLTGRVIDGQGPIAGAAVTLSPSGRRTVTDAAGQFLLANVPAASGYAVDLAAAGYASRTVSGIQVGKTIQDLGDLRLNRSAGSVGLVTLDPEVNPEVSEVEGGGVAHRYYRLTSSLNERAGGSRIQLRRTDGLQVPQEEDGGGDWAGKVPGVADADGIVRLRLPATAISDRAGGEARFEVLLDGQVAQSFRARVVERRRARVWRHEVGGGVSGKVKVFKGEADRAFETEIEQEIVRGTAITETITRRREDELRMGVDIGLGAKVVAGASTHVGAGGFVAVDLFTDYGFAPGTDEPAANLMKLYVALGDTLLVAPPPVNVLYDFARDRVEPEFIRPNLTASGGGLRLGRYDGGEVTIGAKLSSQAKLGVTGDLSAEVAGLFAWENHWDGDALASTERSLGFSTTGRGNLSIGAEFGKRRESAGLSLSLFDFASDAEFRGSLVTPGGAGEPRRLELSQTAGIQASAILSPSLLYPLWWRLGVEGVQSEAQLEFSETLGFDLPDAGTYSRLNVALPLWNLIRSGGGPGLVLRPDQPAALVASTLATALNDGATVDYEREVYAGLGHSIDLGAEVDIGILGLGIGVEGAEERGARVVSERGTIWRYKRMAKQSYPPLAGSDLPSQKIFALEVQWAKYATGLLRQALGEIINRIADAGETVIEAGAESGKAIVRVGTGVLVGGSEVVSRWAAPAADRRVALHARAAEDGYLPPMGAGNYAYGISGTFQFVTTNELQAPVALTLTYTDAQSTGLTETNLAIYRLAEDGRSWRWLGGTVDTNLNQVTTTVTNLGTFALAPPLPMGMIALTKGGDRLLADGQSTMELTAADLRLNTGALAVEPWLYTIEGTGVEIVDADLRPSLPGIQVASEAGGLSFTVRAPVGGLEGRVRVSSVAGDAAGEMVIGLVDDTAPDAPAGATATAGQSRVMVTWQPSAAVDLAGYRIYYRKAAAGPPWDGTAAVEGSASPVWTTGTNLVLRGLDSEASYHVAVTAVDSVGNESELALAGAVTTHAAPPEPPTGVTLRFENGGVAQVSWTRSEDDGFNDRDVVRYEIWRAELPGGDWQQIAELPEGSEVYRESTPAISGGHYLRYAVRAVDGGGLSSGLIASTRFLPGGRTVDNDGDGMDDDWEARYGLNPGDPTDAQADPDGDGTNNLEEYLAGSDPMSGTVMPRFEGAGWDVDGRFHLRLRAPADRAITVEVSEDLVQWRVLREVLPGAGQFEVVDDEVPASGRRFYRAWATGP